MKIVKLYLLILVAVLSACTKQKPISRIDGHIHLWDTEREGSIPWMRPSNSKIYVPHYPEDFIETAGPAGVNSTIVVEASVRREDNFWLMGIVEESDATIAFMANLDPRDPDYQSDLEKLVQYSKFRGIRIRPRTAIDLSDSMVIEGLGLLVKHGLALELERQQTTEEDIIAIARKYPGLNIIVDHLAISKSGREEDFEGWFGRLEKLSSEPNIYCKVSKIYSFVRRNSDSLNVEDYRPLIDPVVDAFGPDRIIFGSDWPLSDMRVSYSDIIKITDEYLEGRPDVSPAKFYRENAIRAFGLDIE